MPRCRSSYDGEGDAVTDWKDSCSDVAVIVDAIVDDCIRKNESLIVEGVSVIPSIKLLCKWRKAGGIGEGFVLAISNETTHSQLISNRGTIHPLVTRKSDSQSGGELGSEPSCPPTLTSHASKQLKALPRIRAIQSEMIRLGRLSNWRIIHRHVVKQ